MSRVIFVLLVFALPSMGATIVLWPGKGEPIQNATVVKVKDGYLYFTTGERKRKMKLLDVRTIEDSAAKESPCRILDLTPVTRSKRSGHRLSIKCNGHGRMPQPYVRLFVVDEDDKGARTARMFRHPKINDPTRTHELPIINAQSYETKHFFARTNTVIGWYAEVWVDGQLMASKWRTPPGKRVDWWRNEPISRTEKLTVFDVLKASSAPSKNASFTPTFSSAINSCNVSQNHFDKEAVVVSLSYDIRTDEKSALLPDVRFYALVRDHNNVESVEQFSGEPKQGSSVPVNNGVLQRRHTIQLPAYITLTKSQFSDDAAMKKLLFWRVEVRVGDHVLAALDSPSATNKPPPGWWID